MSALQKNKIKKESNRGMSYVELIVVLGIFSLMSTVITFNYGLFQSKVDVKNLGNDIALKVVEAQKAALSGKIPPSAQYDLLGGGKSAWKPAYGIYFNLTSGNDSDGIAYNKKFIYFTDVNTVNSIYDGTTVCSNECLEKISITKGNYISAIEKCNNTTCSAPIAVTNPLSILFKRTNSGTTFTSSGMTALTGAEYIRVTIVSPKGGSAYIKIYPSGRVQIN